jgi:hypothetical protein
MSSLTKQASLYDAEHIPQSDFRSLFLELASDTRHGNRETAISVVKLHKTPYFERGHNFADNTSYTTL